MGKRDFTGCRYLAATDQAGIGYGMMGSPERSGDHEGRIFGSPSAGGINSGCFQRLVEAQIREDGRQATGHHGLAGSGNT